MRIAHFVSGFPVLSETFVLDEIAAFAEEGFENVLVSLRPEIRGPLDVDRAIDSRFRGNDEAALSFPRKRESIGDFDLDSQLLSCGRTRKALGLINILYPDPNRFSVLRCITPRSAALLASQFRSGIAHPKELFRILYTGKRILESGPYLQTLGVVHCHAHFAHYPAELAWGCSRLLGTTFSWNAHSYDLYLYRAHLERRIQDAELIFPISDANRKFIEDRALESIESHLHVCRCGIRLDEYTFGRGGGARSAHSETSLEPILLGVGRLVDSKGFADLIRASFLLFKRGLPVKVRIIGEGPERANLFSLARSLGAEPWLDMPGALPRDQVRNEQRCATLLVMPCCPGKNGLDGIPVVLMEAMALGTPVVATSFASIPELVEDGVTGRLVPPNQPEKLADAVSDLLKNPSQRSQLALAARCKVEADYDGPRNYREKARLVKELINSRS